MPSNSRICSDQLLINGRMPKAAEIVDAARTLAANADFAYAKPTGKRMPNLDGEGSRYFAALEEWCAEDIGIHLLTVEVFNLVKPLSALFDGPLRDRISERILRPTSKSEAPASDGRAK